MKQAPEQESAGESPSVKERSTISLLPGVLSLSDPELAEWLHDRGEAPLRARQLRHWLIARGAESFDQMSDLPRSLREELARSFVPLETRVARHLRAADGTHKLLLRL